MKKIYLVSFGAQREEMEEYCFGKCGKISISGGVKFEGGLFGACMESDCPFEEDTLDAGPCELNGVKTCNVTLRKLKER